MNADIEVIDGPGSNTATRYMYRDASNYKVARTVVFEGRFTDQQLADINDNLFDGESFIPSQVGLEDLQDVLREYDTSPQSLEDPESADHVWHDITGFAHTDNDPTEAATFSGFADAFKAAVWDETQALLDHAT
jgi:hypothetical protein